MTEGSDLVRVRTNIGDFEVIVLTDGTYYLDGGAMFGVVPKPLWEKRSPADNQNRVLLGLNTVVVRDGKQIIVIETGIGNKLALKAKQIFENKELLPSAFAAADINPEEVDVVVNTHLHFDHCGWNTTQQADGDVVPTFPNARYYASGGEVEHGRLQLERDAVSYVPANYEPLIANGQMHLVGGPQLIVPGVSLELFPGHTANMMTVIISSGGKTACYISDLIPTSAHLDLTWGMAYDLDPLTVIEQRKRFYARAIPEQWLVLFTHDHATPCGYLEINEKGKPALRPYEGL